MPLTTSPLLLDDLEYKRRAAQQLAASSQAASRQGVDALALMEQLAAKGRAETAKNEQVKLERKGDADREARDVEMHGLNVQLKRKELERPDAPTRSERPVLEPKGGVATGINGKEWLQERNQMLQHPEYFSDEQMEAAGLSRPQAPAQPALVPKGSPQGGLVPKRNEKAELEIELKRQQVEKNKREAEASARAPEEKKRAQMAEVDNFVANIGDNIDALKAQIDATGTFEVFGPESADMERRITAIATDMAKLADPGSVAREGEVALAKKGLFPTGIAGAFTSDSTAKQVLDNLKAEVEKRRANAYRVRGLSEPAPTAASPGPPSSARPTGAQLFGVK